MEYLPSSRDSSLIRSAYIIDSRYDWIWFITLPLVAIMIGLLSERWLSAIAVASVSLWVTTPHHFATWLRAYGVRSDMNRWQEPLILGPLAICLLTAIGIRWAPMTLLLLMWAWDHQHSIMQQYGFSRIYDHKANSNSPTTARLDFALNWILYINLMIVSPLYSDFWIRELYRFGVEIDASTLSAVQSTSVMATCAFGAVYLWHLIRSVLAGNDINPMKYLFIGSSFFLWYSTAWWLQSILVAKIAHAIMHGVQYIVISYSYLRKKEQSSRSFVGWLVEPGHIAAFLFACFVYAFLYQVITAQPLATFGFGAISFTSEYAEPIAALGKSAYSDRQGYELFAALVIQGAAVVHYYLDSFIW